MTSTGLSNVPHLGFSIACRLSCDDSRIQNNNKMTVLFCKRSAHNYIVQRGAYTRSLLTSLLLTRQKRFITATLSSLIRMLATTIPDVVSGIHVPLTLLYCVKTPRQRWVPTLDSSQHCLKIDLIPGPVLTLTASTLISDQAYFNTSSTLISRRAHFNTSSTLISHRAHFNTSSKLISHRAHFNTSSTLISHRAHFNTASTLTHLRHSRNIKIKITLNQQRHMSLTPGSF